MVNNLLEDSHKKHLKEISCKALNEASKIATKLKNSIQVTYKSESQPVTNADREIDNYLKSYFKTHTPNFGWLSEESYDDKSRLNRDFFWCLDPIDGTRSYINKKPEYTISLALIEKSQPVIGHILNPETKEYFYAEKNNGAFCNEKKITVNNSSKLDECKIAISSSEIKKLESYEIFKTKKIKKIGSIAYKIALVAKGEIDIAVSFSKKNDWDLAAADLIIKEAGGNLKDLNGDDIYYNKSSTKINSVLACNSLIINNLANLFNKQ